MKTQLKYIVLVFLIAFLQSSWGEISARSLASTPSQTPEIDNPIAYAESLEEADWGVPSWTKMLAALNKVKKTYTTINLNNLTNVLQEMTAFDVPYSVNASYNGDPTSQIGLAWYTNANLTGGKAQVVQKENAVESDFETPLIVVDASTTQIINTNYLSKINEEVIANTGLPVNTERSYTSNKALITGLMPNTVYSYRVGKAGAWSDIRSFRTSKTGDGDFSFIYITDTQANTESMFNTSKMTLEAALEILPDPQFISVHGDFVESYGSSISSEWEHEQWFDKMSGVISRFPLVPVAGNHDINHTLNLHHHVNTSLDFDENYLQKSSVMPGMTYAFVTGDAIIFVVNFEDYGPQLYSALDKYMTQIIKQYPDKKWRIMFNHSSMYTGGVQHHASSQSRDIRNGFSYFMKKHRIDLALQGHSHVYEVIGPVNHTTRAVIPNSISLQDYVPASFPLNVTGKENGLYNVEGGTLFVLNNAAGKKKYQPQTKEQMDSKYASTGLLNYWNLMTGKFGQSGDPTFSDVKVTTDTIFVNTYVVNDNGVPLIYDKLKVIREDITTGTKSIKHDNFALFYDKNENKLWLQNASVAEKIEVFNINGQKIAQTEQANEIYIGQQRGGVYLVKISIEGESYTSKMLL